MAEVIFLQTAEMRNVINKYRYVLFVDSTYKTNDRYLPLFSIMGVDGIRKGRVAANALVVNEQMETLECVLETFKFENSTEFLNVKTVVIDKDPA